MGQRGVGQRGMRHHDTSEDPGVRRIGLDYLRGFVIVMVVLHHAVLAYCAFGHFNPQHYMWSSAPIVDAERWWGFDILVLFNDSYFMPLMFLLSGLFVRPSLGRKGPQAYVRDRVRRLALPFGLAVLTIIPLAFYPSYRMTGSTAGFGAFWVQTVSDGPWPSGPPWFLAVLFGFDVVAVAVWPLLARLDLRRQGASFVFLATVSVVAYLPLLITFGPNPWLAWGPFSIQGSRILLYAAYFFVGVAAGPALRIPAGRPVMLAVALFAVLLAAQICHLRVPTLMPPDSWLILHGLALALFCAAATRALLALFARFQRRSAAWDSLSANAYGIYLLHYPFVVWGQYALLDWPIGPIPKAAGVFTAALTLSWGCSAGASALLRTAPRSVVGFGRG
jgi:glucan biosynthesis protein C